MLNHDLPQQTKKILLALVKRYHSKRRALDDAREQGGIYALDEFMQDVEAELNALGLTLEGIPDE